MTTNQTNFVIAVQSLPSKIQIECLKTYTSRKFTEDIIPIIIYGDNSYIIKFSTTSTQFRFTDIIRFNNFLNDLFKEELLDAIITL